MKVIFCFIILGLFLLLLPRCAASASVGTVSASPSFFIVRRATYALMEGGETYLLEWTKDGAMQIPADFPSEEARARFEKYLKKIGIVEE